MPEDIQFVLFKNYLNSKVLPGVESHKKMAPLPDRLFEMPAPDSRDAAVILLLYRENEKWHLPLIHRNSNNDKDPHKGQISLPGGRKEKNDQSLLNTALRETREEIGVALDESHIIGQLSSLYIPVSKNKVHPFIAFLDYPPHFERQVNEVDSIWACPVDQIINSENRMFRDLKTSYAENIRVPGIAIDDKWIWGATAMILQEFNDIYTASINP